MKSVCVKHEQAYEVECPYCEKPAPTVAEAQRVQAQGLIQQQAAQALGLHAIVPLSEADWKSYMGQLGGIANPQQQAATANMHPFWFGAQWTGQK